MNGEKFQTPVVRLAREVAENREQGFWDVNAIAPQDLAAVRITEDGWKTFFGVLPNDIDAARQMLADRFDKFEQYVWSLELARWPEDRGISPIKKT